MSHKNNHEKCYAKCLGDCKGGMSGEHYISETVLEHMFPDGKCDVKGLRWQEKSGRQGTVSVNDLQSNILCRHHNSELATLDQAAEEFFKFFDVTGAKLTNSSDTTPPVNVTLSGDSIERWMAKVFCGLLESKNISSLSGTLQKGYLSDDAIKHMFGIGPTLFDWSSGLGFYKLPPHVGALSERALEFITWFTPDEKMFAFEMQLHGMRFLLLFGPGPEGFVYDAWRKPKIIGVASRENGHIAGTLTLTWEPDRAATPWDHLFAEGPHPATMRPVRISEEGLKHKSFDEALGRVQVTARAKPFQGT